MSEPTPESRPKLMLIDGHGLAYRQFHGLPMDKFTTKSGEPTNATWGFARTLLDILQSPTPPEYLAVSFDQGLSGREITYTAYKANRDEMASALSVQIDRIRQLVQAFNIPIMEKAGYEADDVLGAASVQGVSLGVDVHIVTGDRDLLQLVNEHVTIELPAPPAARRGASTEAQVYDIARVIERFGVTPQQYVDFKAFVGDTSDNIPGVKGIGDKGAAQLIQQYGTLDNIYAHLDEIPGKKREYLEQGRENAFLSRDLSRIMIDIPLTLDLTKCVAHDYDPAVVAKLFHELEFRSLTNRLALPAAAPVASGAANSPQQLSMFESDAPAVPTIDPIAPINHVVTTIVVDTHEALDDLVRVLAAAEAISFDTETTGVDQMRADLVGISLAVNAETGYYIPVGHLAPDALTEPPRQLPIATVIEALRPSMTDPHKPKWAHNAPYDLIMLRRYGLDVTPITIDSMIAIWMLDPDRPKGLKDQADRRLNIEMTHIEELIGRGKKQITMAQVPVDRAAPYAAADAAVTYALVGGLQTELQESGLWKVFEQVEMPLVPVLSDIDMNGVKLDLPYLAELGVEFTERLAAFQEEIYELAGQPFNIGSLKQLNEILFDKLKLPTKGLSKSQHGYSIDADALESLSEHHEIVARILEWRGLGKLKSTYVDSLQTLVDSEGRVHTTYNQTGSVTGRISSENPNLQQIPIRTEEGRRVRRAFIASPGYHLLSVDYSQIELRILASFSGDPFLREAFLHDQDVHRATAAAVYSIGFDEVTKEQRYFAKRVNFGLMYGMGAHRLARESGMPMSEAQQFIERYFQRFPGVQEYFAKSKAEAKDKGYLTTSLGRRRYFPSLLAGSGGSQVHRARAEREAINMPIQGTAADIIKIAMSHLAQRLKAERPNARLILQVHDELVLEVPDADIAETAALVREVMETAPLTEIALDVPLRADAHIGLNWAEMSPVDER
ncbi:MAG: DNA polymerase I [Chloroflexota bacterium]